MTPYAMSSYCDWACFFVIVFHKGYRRILGQVCYNILRQKKSVWW